MPNSSNSDLVGEARALAERSTSPGSNGLNAWLADARRLLPELAQQLEQREPIPVSADKELSVTTAGAQSPVVEGFRVEGCSGLAASGHDRWRLLVERLRAVLQTQERRPSRDTKERSED